MAKLLIVALLLVAIGMVCVGANDDGTLDFVVQNKKCFKNFECPVGYFPYNFDGIQGCTRETKNLCPGDEVFSIVDGKLFCTREVRVQDLCDSFALNFYFFDGVYGCSTGQP